MPSSRHTLDYRVDPERGLILVRAHGAVNASFIADAARQIEQDADWSPAIDVIWDLRDVSSLEVSLDGLDEMVEAQASGSAGLDLILTTHPDHDLVMRLYARRVNTHGRPAAVCSTMDEALDMLGMPELPESVRS